MSSPEHLELITIVESTHLSNKMASPSVEEIAKRLRAKDPSEAVVLEVSIRSAYQYRLDHANSFDSATLRRRTISRTPSRPLSRTLATA